MNKPKVLYFLWEYPQFSQSYVYREIAHLQNDYDILVLALNKGTPPISKDVEVPYKIIPNFKQLITHAQSWGPDIIHTHWAFMARRTSKIAEACNAPFTIRSHSFDTLPDFDHRQPIKRTLKNHLNRFIPWEPFRFRKLTPNSYSLYEQKNYLNHPLCLGILHFPGREKTLIPAGIKKELLHPCFPVVDATFFENKTPNGEGIMNTGILLGKKNLKEFIQLAQMVSNRSFTYYGLVTQRDSHIEKYNQQQKYPVDLRTVTNYDQMPAEYKKNQWLVYTMDPEINTVGWPMAIAEAWAAGVAVLIPNIREDLKSYIGDAGIIYNSLQEAAEIISSPPDPAMIARGHERAKLADIAIHKKTLTDIWENYLHNKKAA